MMKVDMGTDEGGWQFNLEEGFGAFKFFDRVK